MDIFFTKDFILDRLYKIWYHRNGQTDVNKFCNTDQKFSMAMAMNKSAVGARQEDFILIG